MTFTERDPLLKDCYHVQPKVHGPLEVPAGGRKRILLAIWLAQFLSVRTFEPNYIQRTQ